LAAACIGYVFRACAPESPYDTDTLKVRRTAARSCRASNASCVFGTLPPGPHAFGSSTRGLTTHSSLTAARGQEVFPLLVDALSHLNDQNSTLSTSARDLLQTLSKVCARLAARSFDCFSR
jgi:hypothetical protein